MEKAAVDGVLSLLREIGPAILLTHSQGGPRGWLAADTAPELVKGILAVEPTGGPFYMSARLTGAQGLGPKTVALPYGLTLTAMGYEPPVADPAILLDWENPANAQRWRLPNLSRVPVTIVAGEASYHRDADILISRYLKAMGVENHLVLLDEVGIHGNGHMMMLERNSDEIAGALTAQITRWNLA
jgi:pimeloyl-ACP methyl ester carboxylesterase